MLSFSIVTRYDDKFSFIFFILALNKISTPTDVNISSKTIFVNSGLNHPLFPSEYVIAPPSTWSFSYNISKKSVFIALSEVFIAGITRAEVIEPPRNVFFSIIRTFKPNLAAV